MTVASPLRVLAFSDYLSEESSGGIERVIREIYHRIQARGTQVNIVTATPYDETGSGLVDGVPIERVRSIDLSRLLGAQVSLAPGLIGRTLDIVDAFRPDVLHANGLHFQTSVAAALCQQLRRIPMVTTVHVGSPRELRWRVRVPTATYEATVGRYILSRSDHVIAVAGQVAEHAQRLGGRRKPVTVVPNGVDRQRFVPKERTAAAGAVPLVLFVGRLIDNKGPGLLLDALGELAEAQVTFRAAFVGDGPLRADLQRRVAETGLGARVQFAGQSTDVAGWLARADVLVRPSFTEGMPLTVLEGLAAGVLVIASDIPGNAGLIRDGSNGLLFPVGDAGALSRRLRYALEHPHFSRRLAARGHETSERYSWEQCAEATLEVLTGVAAANRPRTPSPV